MTLKYAKGHWQSYQLKAVVWPCTHVKCSEDSERMKRKSPFSTTTLPFDTPSLGNPREYLHKPYTARNYVLWATFLSLTVSMGIYANFRTVVRMPETPTANPLFAEPETDFNAKWPSKVIYFGIIEEPLRGYIGQYNKCGLRCEGSEDIASERSENRHFRSPHSHMTPLSRKPPRISA